MNKGKSNSSNVAMLELWRPPQGAGDPVGCLATTYTFAPGLFDEQCLARFLEIGSEPDREDIPFLLEREDRLGSVYAGILVDHTRAGVEHSLRWDVLPVRLPGGKQHAKLSLLAWSRHVRIIVASANLTDPGYRTNQEAAVTVDCRPQETDREVLEAVVAFLRGLLQWVPGASRGLTELQRADGFLSQVTRQTRDWSTPPRGRAMRQTLVVTLPAMGENLAPRSSLDEAVQACRRRGESPREARIASPFFDPDNETSAVTAALCRMMARGGGREICFCVPQVKDQETASVPRLAAPRALFLTPQEYQTEVIIKALPEEDHDKNRRPWHAKMLALRADGYSALMIGSSNFTAAGMGIGRSRNAEANLVTLIDRVAYSRDASQIEVVWERMESIDPDEAEWLGARPEDEEGELSQNMPVPPGFLAATYRAGEQRQVVLRLDRAGLPDEWLLLGCGQDSKEMLSSVGWRQQGCPELVEIPWEPVQPPEKLLVRWDANEAFLPLNVEDRHTLPPPAALEGMSAADMLWILAAADPSAAFRAWAREQNPTEPFDSDLDSATPVDLDPLRRYDLEATFLHRIRHRARVLAQLRANLQRPVWTRQALEWRLRGMIGIEPLADRLLREFEGGDGAGEEALLALADFLVVLAEVDYQPSDGALCKKDFEQIFRPFLAALAAKLQEAVQADRARVSEEGLGFWERVVERCRA